MITRPETRWKILFLFTLIFLVAIVTRLIIIEKKLSYVLAEITQDSKIHVKSDKDQLLEDHPFEDEKTGDVEDHEEVVPYEKMDPEVVTVKDVPIKERYENKGIFSFTVPVTASFFNTFGRSPVIAELAEKTGNKRLAKLLSAHIARNLVFDFDMRRDIYPGDEVSAVFRTVSLEEASSREDMPDEIEILAMRYRSVKFKREFLFYAYKPSGYRFRTFFDENGYAVEKMLKNSPIREWIQITAVLNDRRPRHDGIDFKAPVGTPVYAPWDGRVLRTNWNTRYNGISLEAEVNTNPKIYMILLHLNKLHVKSGDSFKAGDHIADVGNTGRSFAPHLHYQLQRERGRTNRIIDPVKFHGTIERSVPESDKAAFESLKKEMNDLMDGS